MTADSTAIDGPGKADRPHALGEDPDVTARSILRTV
jgi:hypothetical protein